MCTFLNYYTEIKRKNGKEIKKLKKDLNNQ